MNKIEKAVLKKDPSIKELSKIISDIIIEHYGEHNYEFFVNDISKRLGIKKEGK